MVGTQGSKWVKCEHTLYVVSKQTHFVFYFLYTYVHIQKLQMKQ